MSFRRLQRLIQKKKEEESKENSQENEIINDEIDRMLLETEDRDCCIEDRVSY